MKDKITTLQIHVSVWNELNKRKKFGESFEDVIKRMLLEFPVNKSLAKQIKEEVSK